MGTQRGGGGGALSQTPCKLDGHGNMWKALGTGRNIQKVTWVHTWLCCLLAVTLRLSSPRDRASISSFIKVGLTGLALFSRSTQASSSFLPSVSSLLPIRWHLLAPVWNAPILVPFAANLPQRALRNRCNYFPFPIDEKIEAQKSSGSPRLQSASGETRVFVGHYHLRSVVLFDPPWRSELGKTCVWATRLGDVAGEDVGV